MWKISELDIDSNREWENPQICTQNIWAKVYQIVYSRNIYFLSSYLFFFPYRNLAYLRGKALLKKLTEEFCKSKPTQFSWELNKIICKYGQLDLKNKYMSSILYTMFTFLVANEFWHITANM